MNIVCKVDIDLWLVLKGSSISVLNEKGLLVAWFQKPEENGIKMVTTMDDMDTSFYVNLLM